MQPAQNGCELLKGYRALDLTDSKGYLCGKILADLGADVLKVEPPAGDVGRSIGPFYHNVPQPERSLYWYAYNQNKRGITMDANTADGRELLRRLVTGADFLIESFKPGYLESLGLGYQTLRKLSERLVLVSITPFGQTGPYSLYQFSDLVGMAMGGEMYLCGDPDRPPLRITFPQSCLHACVDAAAGALVAHYRRESTGKGQCVDVSIQHSVSITAFVAYATWHLQHTVLHREGSYQVGITISTKLKLIWECQDGFIIFRLLGGPTGARTNKALIGWMNEEGMSDCFLNSFDFSKVDIGESQEALDQMNEHIARFFSCHTKEELFSGAITRGIILCPLSTPSDLFKNEQLDARAFWQKVEHVELGDDITYPGAFAKMSATPMVIYRRAPMIGEHNEEIYCGELGLSRKDLVALKQARVI